MLGKFPTFSLRYLQLKLCASRHDTQLMTVSTETTEGQYSPVRLELARLVSSLLYGIRAMLVLNLPAFENKKYTAYDRFHGNGPYGEIPTKQEPIRTLGFALPYNKCVYVSF